MNQFHLTGIDGLAEEFRKADEQRKKNRGGNRDLWLLREEARDLLKLPSTGSFREDARRP